MTKTIKIGQTVQVIFFVLAVISAALWITFAFIPDKYHFECVGTVTKFEEGDFRINDTESHTVEKYDYRITYMPFDGTEEKVVHFRNNGTDVYNHIRNYHERNSWTYVYRYRYGMIHWLYLCCAIVLVIIAVSIDDDWTIDIEVSDDTDLKFRKKDNSNDKIW